MISDKNKEDNFELRSESVRNIVGQIPPALIRYGIIVIVLVLIMLIVVSSLVPYSRVVRGNATINEISLSSNDSLKLTVQLSITSGNTDLNIIGCKIEFQSPNFNISGRLLSYNPQRNINAKNEAEVLVSGIDLHKMSPSNVDFIISIKQTSVFQYLLGK